MREALDRDAILAWLALAADRLEAEKANLSELDRPIGDGDHGVNMARGFAAVRAKLAAEQPADPAAVLKAAAMVLLSTVGGASGPLYATLLLQAAGKATGKPSLSTADWADCLAAGLAGIVQRGKAAVGDKTMVDALDPAVRALDARRDQPLAAALAASAEAAREGMAATVPLVARKGRASYLGERSAGHQDPGATSSHLLLQALAETAARS
ncbi:dihydroxyacetone kinase subunit DhaL [Benzoatithermus flavus]|uniref:Dihydroxyacetone kinase subunit DhaL n=1 Tax=Benzoatithermus flavus TaxID=3108223 RepID=A0ABU8XWX7_9PROT